MKFIVPNEMTLLEALVLAAPDSTRTTLRSWVKLGRIAINGNPERVATTPVLQGQTITLTSRINYVEKGVKIIFEDRDIVVIEKPKGLLSVATPFEEADTAFAILKRKYKPKKVHVVHRLDQDTSGVMVFALSEEAQKGLKKLFEKHDIERKYAAVVEGHLSQDEGTWSSYLLEDERYFVYSTSDTSKGELAITHYKVLATSRKHSLLELQLETGKKNQIRVHCAENGHPVAGDKKYRAEGNPAKRMCLHAFSLSFKHPITGKLMHFKSEVPKSFYRIVNPSI